jgi:cytochrome c5
MSEAAEAQTADAKLAKERTRTSAELAAVMLAAAELWLARVFHSFCSGCHISSSVLNLCALPERHPELAQ